MPGVKTLQTVDRALAVLDLIAERQPIGVSRLARELDLDKSAVQRILMSLSAAGWTRSDGSRPVRWMLSTKPLQLSRRVAGSWLVDRARRTIESLGDRTGETVWLCVLDGHRLVVVDGIESPHPLRTSVRRGFVPEPRHSASGRAVLSALPENEWDALLGEPADARLREEVATARRLGYAANTGEVTSGINAVAAVVTSAGGRPIGTLIVSAPADRLSGRRIAGTGRATASAARELSALVR